jgi:hypothetical protein
MITTFEDYNNSKEELETFETKICNLIDEWIKIGGYPKTLYRYKKCFKFTKPDFEEYPAAKEEGAYLHINFTKTDFDNGYITLNKDEYEDLLNFINDPELYKATKNYNL